MKIIGWNCNGAFRKKHNKILSLNPDILVVSECENPEKLKIGKLTPEPRDLKWFGENPNKGIGVFAYGNYSFELLEDYNPRFKLVIPLKVISEERSFLLFCIWTKENKYDKNAGYIGQIWYAINYYSNLLSNYNSLIIGDFNSNKIWDSKRPNSNHSRVVNYLKNYSIESLYHMQHKEEQGEETSPTFFLHKKITKPYHIDYCFASKEIYKNKFSIKIGKFENWIGISDHVPIIVELNWTPKDEKIINSLYESIKNKFEVFDNQQVKNIDELKKQILEEAFLLKENGNLEKEVDRLKIVENTEDILNIFSLIDKIKKRKLLK